MQPKQKKNGQAHGMVLARHKCKLKMKKQEKTTFFMQIDKKKSTDKFAVNNVIKIAHTSCICNGVWRLTDYLIQMVHMVWF